MEMFQFIEEATTPSAMEPLIGSPFPSVDELSLSPSLSPSALVVPMQEVIAADGTSRGSPLQMVAERSTF